MEGKKIKLGFDREKNAAIPVEDGRRDMGPPNIILSALVVPCRPCSAGGLGSQPTENQSNPDDLRHLSGPFKVIQGDSR
jgi:hypothetical protein